MMGLANPRDILDIVVTGNTEVFLDLIKIFIFIFFMFGINSTDTVRDSQNCKLSDDAVAVSFLNTFVDCS